MVGNPSSEKEVKDLLAAARDVVEAYTERFETSPGTMFGPIDCEIRELKAAILKVRSA